MQLKIKAKIADDRAFRYSYNPYDINRAALKDSIASALADALYHADHSEPNITVPLKFYGDAIGTLKISVK